MDGLVAAQDVFDNEVIIVLNEPKIGVGQESPPGIGPRPRLCRQLRRCSSWLAMCSSFHVTLSHIRYRKAKVLLRVKVQCCK